MRILTTFILFVFPFSILAQQNKFINLPKSYSLPDVAYALESQTEKLKKNQFESKQEYYKRIEGQLNEIKIGNPQRKLSEFVTVYNVMEANEGKDIFNAEFQFFHILPSSRITGGKQSNSLSKYKGADIVLVDYTFGGDEIKFNIPSNQAKTIAPKLQIAYFGFPQSLIPYHKDGDKRNAVYNVEMRIHLIRIVCFNNETGEIYFDASRGIDDRWVRK